MSSSFVLFWQGDRGDRGTRGQPGAVGPVGPMGAKVCIYNTEAFYMKMSYNNFTQKCVEVVSKMLEIMDQH